MRAEVINLLVRLQDELALSYVFISHDLTTVRHLADVIDVMYLGHVVESGPYDDVLGGRSIPTPGPWPRPCPCRTRLARQSAACSCPARRFPPPAPWSRPLAARTGPVVPSPRTSVEPAALSWSSSGPAISSPVMSRRETLASRRRRESDASPGRMLPTGRRLSLVVKEAAMGSRIEWVMGSCRLLAAIGEEFDSTRPFAGRRIGTGIHLEPKTVALLLTLRRGGADVVSTGNLGSTQVAAVEYLRAHGVEVVGDPTTDAGEHDAYLREVLACEPDLILDNGGDLFVRYLEAPYSHLLGGTEETTSGRMRLVPLREQIAAPGARDKRQPDQAVRRELPRCRPECARVVPAHHQPDDQRPACRRLRLRVLWQRRRCQLPQRLRERLGSRP